MELFQCRWEGCDAAFKLADDLWNHVESAHITVARRTSKNPFECKWQGCTFHTFNRKDNYRTHLLGHQPSAFRPLHCARCDYSSRYSSDMNKHWTNKHWGADRTAPQLIQHKCEVCDFTSPQSYLARRHCSSMKASSQVPTPLYPQGADTVRKTSAAPAVAATPVGGTKPHAGPGGHKGPHGPHHGLPQPPDMHHVAQPPHMRGPPPPSHGMPAPPHHAQHPQMMAHGAPPPHHHSHAPVHGHPHGPPPMPPQHGMTGGPGMPPHSQGMHPGAQGHSHPPPPPPHHAMNPAFYAGQQQQGPPPPQHGPPPMDPQKRHSLHGGPPPPPHAVPTPPQPPMPPNPQQPPPPEQPGEWGVPPHRASMSGPPPPQGMMHQQQQQPPPRQSMAGPDPPRNRGGRPPIYSGPPPPPTYGAQQQQQHGSYGAPAHGQPPQQQQEHYPQPPPSQHQQHGSSEGQQQQPPPPPQYGSGPPPPPHYGAQGPYGQPPMPPQQQPPHSGDNNSPADYGDHQRRYSGVPQQPGGHMPPRYSTNHPQGPPQPPPPQQQPQGQASPHDAYRRTPSGGAVPDYVQRSSPQQTQHRPPQLRTPTDNAPVSAGGDTRGSVASSGGQPAKGSPKAPTPQPQQAPQQAPPPPPPYGAPPAPHYAAHPQHPPPPPYGQQQPPPPQPSQQPPNGDASTAQQGIPPTYYTQPRQHPPQQQQPHRAAGPGAPGGQGQQQAAANGSADSGGVKRTASEAEMVTAGDGATQKQARVHSYGQQPQQPPQGQQQQQPQYGQPPEPPPQQQLPAGQGQRQQSPQPPQPQQVQGQAPASNDAPHGQKYQQDFRRAGRSIESQGPQESAEQMVKNEREQEHQSQSSDPSKENAERGQAEFSEEAHKENAVPQQFHGSAPQTKQNGVATTATVTVQQHEQVEHRHAAEQQKKDQDGKNDIRDARSVATANSKGEAGHIIAEFHSQPQEFVVGAPAANISMTTTSPDVNHDHRKTFPTRKNTLKPGQAMAVGETLTSVDGTVVCELLETGRLVIRRRKLTGAQGSDTKGHDDHDQYEEEVLWVSSPCTPEKVSAANGQVVLQCMPTGNLRVLVVDDDDTIKVEEDAIDRDLIETKTAWKALRSDLAVPLEAFLTDSGRLLLRKARTEDDLGATHSGTLYHVYGVTGSENCAQRDPTEDPYMVWCSTLCNLNTGVVPVNGTVQQGDILHYRCMLGDLDTDDTMAATSASTAVAAETVNEEVAAVPRVSSLHVPPEPTNPYFTVLDSGCIDVRRPVRSEDGRASVTPAGPIDHSAPQQSEEGTVTPTSLAGSPLEQRHAQKEPQLTTTRSKSVSLSRTVPLPRNWMKLLRDVYGDGNFPAPESVKHVRFSLTNAAGVGPVLMANIFYIEAEKADFLQVFRCVVWSAFAKATSRICVVDITIAGDLCVHDESAVPHVLIEDEVAYRKARRGSATGARKLSSLTAQQQWEARKDTPAMGASVWCLRTNSGISLPLLVEQLAQEQHSQTRGPASANATPLQSTQAT
eukprot:Clim_evm53s199 gene=Clim_evmTU53s199